MASSSRRPALLHAEPQERIAEVVLGPGPLERHPRAGQFLQGVAIGGDGLLEPRHPALPLAERFERIKTGVEPPGPRLRTGI
jgi:hypothetical protein